MKNLIVSLAFSTAMIAGAGHAGTLTQVGGNGTPSSGASLGVFESLENGIGTYDVTNNTGGELLGFGVSNNDSFAGFIDPNNNNFTGANSTASADNNANSQFTYAGRTLKQFNWGTEELSDGVTFIDIFDDFSDAAGGENTINWYDAVDGALQDGDTVSGFFAFNETTLASSIIGVTSTQGGPVYFTAGQATTGTTMPPVPLPAAGWMLIAGLGGLGLIRRRKKG